MKRYLITCLMFASLSFGQRCSSISAAASGGWSPIKTAPRDGTVVEILETFGIAPWYDIYKWTEDAVAFGQYGKQSHIKTKPHWESASRAGHGLLEDECAFWRPYKNTSKPYSDPTGGAQNSVEYWCRAAGVAYNKKTGYCN